MTFFQGAVGVLQKLVIALGGGLSIPVQFEPAVRSLRATIPEAQSHKYCHQKHYSTVLLT